MHNIILASKSKVRKEILDKNNIFTQVEQSNIDEDTLIKQEYNKNKESIKISILELQEKLDTAIEKEEYELAATLRDKINKLED